MAAVTYLKNRLPSDAINNDILLKWWNERDLTTKDLQILNPFDCIVYNYIDKQIQDSRNKLKSTGVKDCFICYVSSSLYKFWKFAWKCFVFSHNLTFKETEFPQTSDFDQPPANTTSTNPVVPQQQLLQPQQLSELLELQLLQEPQSMSEPKFIYDEITILPPPIGHVFAIHGPLAYLNPITFADAMSHADLKLWWKAIVNEIKANVQNGTWQPATLPEGKKVIPLKWAYKIKLDAKGNFEKYKARIIVRGFSQIVGLDFEETFALVVQIESIHIIFSIAAANDLHIIHIDCKNAFLHDDNDVEIYVTQPEGFLDVKSPEKVLRLIKSLYGLKQGPCIWYFFCIGWS